MRPHAARLELLLQLPPQHRPFGVTFHFGPADPQSRQRAHIRQRPMRPDELKGLPRDKSPLSVARIYLQNRQQIVRARDLIQVEQFGPAHT